MRLAELVVAALVGAGAAVAITAALDDSDHTRSTPGLVGVQRSFGPTGTTIEDRHGHTIATVRNGTTTVP